MRMGTAQKQKNIAIQHRYFNKHGKPQRPQPMGFREWLLRGMEHYKKEYGFTYELLTPRLMRISRPGQNSILRTCENFRQEYKKEYLSKF